MSVKSIQTFPYFSIPSFKIPFPCILGYSPPPPQKKNNVEVARWEPGLQLGNEKNDI